MLTYKQSLHNAMLMLAEDNKALFIGQAVAYPGTGMTSTFEGINREQLVEMPVAEDLQLGVCVGLSLSGFVPVSIFPRINFMMLAMNQLVLHLDALPRYSDYRPKVIMRTAVACDKPLNPGHQHLGDYSFVIRDMLKTVNVVRLMSVDMVMPAYKEALASEKSTLLVEFAELYDRVY